MIRTSSQATSPTTARATISSIWEINGIRCGALICYEYRFPELLRQYKRDGVQLLFHSFHAANASSQRVDAIGAAIGPELRRLNPASIFTYPGITMPAAMTAAAASQSRVDQLPELLGA